MQSSDWLVTRTEGDTVYFEVHQNSKLRGIILLNYFFLASIITTLGIIFIGSEGAGKIIGYFLALCGFFYAFGTIATGLRFLRKGKIKNVVKFSVSPKSINLILKNNDSYPAQIDRSDIVKLFIHQPEDKEVVQQQYEYYPTSTIAVGVVPVLTAAAMDASKGLGRSLGHIMLIMIETAFNIQNKVNKSSYCLGVNSGGTKIQIASNLLKDQAIFLFHKVEEAISGRTGSNNSNTNNRYSVTPAQLSAAGGGRVKPIILFSVLSLVVAFKAYLYVSPIISKNIEIQKNTELDKEIAKREHLPWSLVVQKVKAKSGEIVLHGEVTERNVFLKNMVGANTTDELPLGTPVDLYGCSKEAHRAIEDDMLDVTVEAKIPGTNKVVTQCGWLNKKEFAILAENTSQTN